MFLRWRRKLKLNKSYTKRHHESIEKIAYKLYENRLLLKRPGDASSDWKIAEKILESSVRKIFFAGNRHLIKLEKEVLEPMVIWANNLALLELLSLVGNIGLIIAVGMYIASEKQRRDTEILTAWQTISNAHGQPGNAGRKDALEFLNASPRNSKDDYPGANWRRRAICLWICTWEPKSLAGIDLSVDPVDISDLNTQSAVFNFSGNLSDVSELSIQNSILSEVESEEDTRRVFLYEAQLPKAILWRANLQGVELAKANLQGADLPSANLQNASLFEANLQGAYLSEANLQGAYLSEANLQGATMDEANLQGADLTDANLQGAKLLNPEQLKQAKLCRTKLPPEISLDPNRDCQE